MRRQREAESRFVCGMTDATAHGLANAVLYPMLATFLFILHPLHTWYYSSAQVVVRVRPVLPHEFQSEVAVSCAPDGAKVQVTLPQRSGASQRAGARSYKFDACLPGSTSQVQDGKLPCCFCTGRCMPPRPRAIQSLNHSSNECRS